MSNTVKLSAKLAGDEDLNGLDSQVDELVADRKTARIAVIWYDVSKVVEGTDDESRVPYVRIRRFEPIGTAEDMPEGLRSIVEQAAEDRTGKSPLPYDAVDGIEVED